MKINFVLTVIAVAIASLLGFLVYNFCVSTDNATALGITTALSLALPLISIMGLKHENSRTQVNLKVLSTIFLLVFIITAAVVCFVNIKNLSTYYIIVGLIALIYLGIFYSISRIDDI